MSRVKNPSRIALAWGLLALAAAAQQIGVAAVDAIGITVSDADKATDFYSRVLQFTKVSDRELSSESFERAKGIFGARARIIRMRLGGEEIELTQYLTPEGRPFPEGSRGNDRWFQHVAIIVRDMEAAYQRLRKNNVRHASTGPQTLPAWNRNAGGIKAFYFRDPDGHFLELLQFPADKGDKKWHRPGEDLFMGIDHTAITIRDTEASLRFYRDALGMRVAGTSENYGTEQEHLNNVFGAHLRITALRASSGPGVELLEYITPRDGRPYPTDARANDLVHYETRLQVRDLSAALDAARNARLDAVSPQPTNFNAQNTEFQIKDPDGHVVAFIGPKQVSQRQ